MLSDWPGPPVFSFCIVGGEICFFPFIRFLDPPLLQYIDLSDLLCSELLL